MIQANELRIGNYAIDTVTKELIEVEEIGQIIIKVSPQHLLNHQRIKYLSRQFTELKPIPLTEEILLKCGFVYDDFCPEYSHYNINFDKVANYWFTIQRKIGTEIFCYETNNSLTQVLTVDQLQNLYFALTNQELKIEL